MKYYSSLVPTKSAKERIEKIIDWEVEEGVDHSECAERLGITKFALTQALHRYSKFYRVMLMKKMESERLRAELLVSGARTRQYKRLVKIQDAATDALADVMSNGSNEMARVAAAKQTQLTIGIGVAKNSPSGIAGKLAEDVVKAVSDTLGIVRKAVQDASIPSGIVIDGEFVEENGTEAPQDDGFGERKTLPSETEQGV